MGFFSADGGFYKFLSRFWDMVKLNFLWILFSLPIVTIGAATVAAYSVSLKMIDDSEGYIGRQFWKAFKDNLKQGILLGIINMICLFSLYLDVRLSENIIFVVIGILSAFLFFVSLIYAYPLLARYDNTIPRTIKNSIKISMRYFGRTLFLVVVLFIEWYIFYMNWITMLIAILVAPAVVILTISGFAMHFFRIIEKEAGTVIKEKTEEDLYNEEIERETAAALEKEKIQ